MKISTKHEYLRAKADLAWCLAAIEQAPANAKPVFRGIVELHDAIHQYEKMMMLASGPDKTT